jgi:hypothetical protein
LWALPILLLWANVHGSVLLGAGGVALAAVWVAVRERRPEGLLIAAAAVLCALVTPYGFDIFRYYHLLIVDPPFGDAIVEWQRSTPSGLTAVFFVVLVASAVLVASQRRRLTWFEVAVLVLLAAQALDAVRGIGWFSLAVAMFVPNAVDGALGARSKVQVRRPDRPLAFGFAIATVVTLAVVATRPASWFERTWPNELLSAVRSTGPDSRVYPTDRHADWLLWRLPELRGRIAYDVRFEVLSKPQFREIAYFDNEYGKEWKRAAVPFHVIVVDETDEPSHTTKLAAEPGARVLRPHEDVSVVVRGS